MTNNNSGVSSARYRGRWYGLMVCLGEKSGRDMKEKLKDKASEVLTMLEISNEYPEEFKFVNKLCEFEDEKKTKGENLTADQLQADYLLGAVEAKMVYLEGEHWERLLFDGDISNSQSSEQFSS